ncbi:MAG TPA: hypothetical protein DDZ74_20295 [Pseudomonas sp.]|uniref:Uncharacterized protein n=1 Tax=Pseudomonas hunanensis TaxID=1247546 RepID=A0ABD6MVY2_9PSED|nr:hypothetical protein [Pseudomonas hunanensis]TFW37585.1 hypothetical protein E4195_11540 [Pseudomonas putida]HBK51564.1 hypothetical protein [Pseudomonas sp.]
MRRRRGTLQHELWHQDCATKRLNLHDKHDWGCTAALRGRARSHNCSASEGNAVPVGAGKPAKGRSAAPAFMQATADQKMLIGYSTNTRTSLPSSL